MKVLVWEVYENQKPETKQSLEDALDSALQVAKDNKDYLMCAKISELLNYRFGKLL